MFEVLKGHDFSRAANRPKQFGASAPGRSFFAPHRHRYASSDVPFRPPGAPWSGVPCCMGTVTSVRSKYFRFNVGFLWLLPDSEFADHVAIAVRIVHLQIIQQAAALAHQHQQPTPGCMILL